MRRVWFAGVSKEIAKEMCEVGTPVVVDGRWDCAQPYLYAIGDKRPASKLAVRVVPTDLNPMAFDGLRYAPTRGKVWRVYARSPGDIPRLRGELVGKGYLVSQSYIKFGLRIAGDANLRDGAPNISSLVLEAVQRRPSILTFDVEVVGGKAYVGFTVDGEDVTIITVERGGRVRPKHLPSDVEYAVGYNSWEFDAPYMPAVGRYVLQAGGRLVPHVDLFPLFAGGFGSSLGKTEAASGLYDVAHQLGVHRELGLTAEKLLQVKRLRGKLSQLTEDEVKNYLVIDVLVTYALASKVLPILEGLGAAVGGDALTVAQVGETASPGHLFEFLIHKEMEHLGYVLADREREWDYPAGDKVRVRAAGIFRNVAEYDFSAMYPSLIAQDGVDPTSVLECSDGHEVVLGQGKRDKFEPAVSKKVCFEGGPIWQLHVSVLEARKAVKKVSKAADQAVKILANSGYGIYGKAGLGVINEWVAAYIAQKSDAIHADLWQRYKPLYGDTDSIYVEVGGEPEVLLKEINAYVADRWKGPFGARLELKLEGVWDYVWIPVTEKGKPAEKNYVKIRGEEVVVKGGDLRPHKLPLFLRYGEFHWWAKALISGAAAVSELLAKVEKLPIEELFIEDSFSPRELFYSKEGEPIKSIDISRQPAFALLAARHGRLTAKFEGREVQIDPQLVLDEIETLWYLPVSTKDEVYTYILLLDGAPVEVSFTAALDRKLGRLEVRLSSKRQVEENKVRERAKAVILEHKLFSYFAQTRLL